MLCPFFFLYIAIGFMVNRRALLKRESTHSFSHSFYIIGFIKQQLRKSSKKNQIKPQQVIPVVVAVKEKPTQLIKKKPVIKATIQRRTNYTSNYTTPSLYQSPPVSVH